MGRDGCGRSWLEQRGVMNQWAGAWGTVFSSKYLNPNSRTSSQTCSPWCGSQRSTGPHKPPTTRLNQEPGLAQPPSSPALLHTQEYRVHRQHAPRTCASNSLLMNAHDSLGCILAPSPWMHISQFNSPKIHQGLLWNENISCHIIKQDLSPPPAISGLQMWTRAPQTVIEQTRPAPMVTAEEVGEGEQHGERGNRAGPRADVCVKGMDSLSPRACIFPYTERYKFLSLTPDLWRSDCLLPMLQTCTKPDYPSLSP